VVAVAVGIVGKVVLVFLVGGVELGRHPHIGADGLVLITIQLPIIEQLL